MRVKSVLASVIFALLAGGLLLGQVGTDVLGQHQLTVGSNSPVTGTASSCSYCHAPHSGMGGITPLWNHRLSTATYTPYVSSTYHQTGKQPVPGRDSSLCLSCHDGTVAVGQTVVYGNIPVTGTMNKTDLVGAADVNNQHPLQPQHPFSLTTPLTDSPDLASSLAAQGKTGDSTGAVKLVQGNVECTSCHEPHVQDRDPVSQNFLVKESSSGQMCLACHDPTRSLTGQPGPTQWQKNPLTLWTNSIHALAANKVTPSANVGGYPTVGQNACLSCHMPHNAPGPVRLTRAANEQDCLTCHSANSNVSPAAPDVWSEYSKTGNVGHPFPQGSNQHDALEDLVSQSVVPQNNRHATCVDCHNPHSTYQVASFAGLTAPAIRGSQMGVAGVVANGTSTINPAVNQYENCLRCHGNSTGKVANSIYGYLPVRAVAASDSLNVILEFSLTATSSHPVMYPIGSGSLPQPSLLTQMWNLNGTTQGRTMGSQIFCTDCHNNDDNREFGGSSPNGPHGSKNSHILERQYLYTQATTPGLPIPSNFLYPSPDLSPSPTGPYAMCAKCHNLTNLDLSWSKHLEHINTGFSCSVCHTAHGMSTTSATLSGQRLVNFDLNVVAKNGTNEISYSYNGGNDTCTLMCHGYNHNPGGTVTPAAVGIKNPAVLPIKRR